MERVAEHTTPNINCYNSLSATYIGSNTVSSHELLRNRTLHEFEYNSLLVIIFYTIASTSVQTPLSESSTTTNHPLHRLELNPPNNVYSGGFLFRLVPNVP